MQPLSPPAELTTRQRRVVMVGLVLSIFLAALDQTILGTALPRIAADLGSSDEISWVISAYLLASTATTPIYGKLSDLYGRRPMLQAAIIIFVAASVLCALAGTLTQLVGARLLQGIGGGGLMTMSLATIADIVSPRERGRYQAFNSTAWALASMLGPILGGAFAQYASWRYVFWINLPFGLAALAASHFGLKMLAPRRVRHAIDYLGAVLIMSAASCAMLATTLGPDATSWTDPTVVPLWIVTAILVGLAIRQERRAREPILAPRLFRDHTFLVANAISMLSTAALMGVPSYLPVYFQLVHGVGPVDAGLMMLPSFLLWPLTSATISRLTTTTGRYRIFPIIGTAILLLGLLLLIGATRETPTALIAAYAALVGLGGGFIGPIAMLALQNAVAPRDVGAATGGYGFFRSLGGSFGVAMCGTIAIAGMDSAARSIPGHEALGDRPGAALLHAGAHAAQLAPPAIREAIGAAVDGAFQNMFIAAAIAAALALIAAYYLKELPLRTTSPRADEAAQSKAAGE